ncbi:copper amine oxidase N-terminal domain-containing protein [Paenibacillus sp. J5C_2022]|uniref:copper amine oxidase N-terminal domain-containing protein n=1 Tax=Paenibacillus sp. J5C2022 TaxID=2977129 RepID=UPI0021CF1D6F|nr:copper amine oxidase N-terminal domain-containing protein [Paenibacillus sp. J5C2022]MCU6710221.1 copper amine oxidase N-terminal domain-containing protein [Paenibacillus sp. J5C2022]
MKKWTAVALLVPALLLGATAGAFASSHLEAVKANLNHGLQFKLDGIKWVPKTDDGLNVLPITYKGTTYLPLRSVATALDIAVDYEADTMTVLLGEKSEGTPVAQYDIDPHYDFTQTTERDFTLYDGVDYKEVFYAEGIASAEHRMTLYPDKDFQTLYLNVIAVDADAVVRALAGNKEIRNAVVHQRDGLTTVEIDVGGLESVDIVVTAADQWEPTDVIIPINSYYK